MSELGEAMAAVQAQNRATMQADWDAWYRAVGRACEHTFVPVMLNSYSGRPDYLTLVCTKCYCNKRIDSQPIERPSE